jgi:hypothetical protein
MAKNALKVSDYVTNATTNIMKQKNLMVYTRFDEIFQFFISEKWDLEKFHLLMAISSCAVIPVVYIDIQ